MIFKTFNGVTRIRFMGKRRQDKYVMNESEMKGVLRRRLREAIIYGREEGSFLR